MRTPTHLTLIAFAFSIWSSTAWCQSDPLPSLLTQLSSTDLATRENAFDSLVILGLQSTPTPLDDGSEIDRAFRALMENYPTYKDSLTLGVIRLFDLETSLPDLGLQELSTSPDAIETNYGEYYARVAQAVVALNDSRTLPSLLPYLNTGNMVIDRVVSFGTPALDPVIAALYSSAPEVRDGATFALLKMLSPQFQQLFSDPTSRAKIAAGLTRSAALAPNRFMFDRAASAVSQLPRLVLGDLDSNGVVNCADVALIRRSNGKMAAQPGFDIRADINGDGVINKTDLKTLRRLTRKELECDDRD